MKNITSRRDELAAEYCDSGYADEYFDAETMYREGFDACLNELKPQIDALIKSFRKYAMHIDTCVYHCGPSIEYDCDCGLEEALTKYKAFMDGGE